MYDIKIMNAKTRNSSKLVSIGIIGDKIADMLQAGIPAVLGQDDIAGVQFASGSILASHLLWMITFKDMEELYLYSMITTYAGKVLGLQSHILQEGGDADLVVLQNPDVYHARQKAQWN